MVRPTRSRVVTESDIVLALRGCNLIKTKSFDVEIVGISAFASPEAFAGWLTLEPSAGLQACLVFPVNLAGGWRGFNRRPHKGGRVPRKQA
jgi:hypothetical protein